MTDDRSRDRDLRIAKLDRMVGMRPEEKQRIADLQAQYTDWTTTCRWCGQKRTGTIAELSKPHNCKVS